MYRPKQVKKSPDYFYFEVFTGTNAILIRRKNKEEAVEAFKRYVAAKKRCAWHGKWNGKKFELSDWETMKESA